MWSLENRGSLGTVSNEQRFLMQMKSQVERFYFILFYFNAAMMQLEVSTDSGLFWQVRTALLKGIKELQPIKNRNGTQTCQM